MEIKIEDKEKWILGLQAAVGIAYLALALKESTKNKSPKMKKNLARQAKRLDKLNRLEYRQEKKAIKRRGKAERKAMKALEKGKGKGKAAGGWFSILRQKS